jgi:hypothetical protein
MKHNTCPHCGAHISFRQRFFTKKGEIHCAHCGGMSSNKPTVTWFCGYISILYSGMMLGQYWSRQSLWWCCPVIMALAFLILSLCQPLVLIRELTRREKIWRALLLLVVLIAWNFMLISWMHYLDAHRGLLSAQIACPPPVQSSP